MKSTRAISLDEYVDFLRSDRQTDLTVSYLNQILSMHGFRKLRHLKKVLIDAVKTIDLIDPSRSTLKESVSSDASLKLEDVIADLNALDWHDCCATSFMILCKDNSLATKDDSLSPRRALQGKENQNRKGKEEGKCHYSVNSSSTGTVSTCQGSKTPNKRKRKNIT